MNGEEKPVAWRVKDYADGWIFFLSEPMAKDVAEPSGALIEPLYTRVPINRPSPEAGESGLVERLREVGLSQQHIDTDFARSTLAAGTIREAADEITRLQAELAEARKERDDEKDARRSLSMLAADEVDTAIALRDLLFRARWYVNDALEAHEHSDGRDLLRDIDAALPAQALASLSPAKDEETQQ